MVDFVVIADIVARFVSVLLELGIDLVGVCLGLHAGKGRLGKGKIEGWKDGGRRGENEKGEIREGRRMERGMGEKEQMVGKK